MFTDILIHLTPDSAYFKTRTEAAREFFDEHGYEEMDGCGYPFMYSLTDQICAELRAVGLTFRMAGNGE